MSTPTPAQIAQVQQNLDNLIALNDYIYNYGNNKVLNAYLLLSEQDNSGLGLAIGLNIVEGVFWGIGGSFGPVGNFLASFCSGMVSYWATDTPPSLNTTFSSVLNQISTMFRAFDAQMATYKNDVAGNWNTSFSYNGKTGTLSDLANLTIPTEKGPDSALFQSMTTAGIFALDQQIWTTVMQTNYVVTLWVGSNDQPMPGDQNDPPVAWDQMFIGKNPAYYNTWSWHDSSGCGDTSGWNVNEYNIGTGGGVFSDGSMSDAACGYLFIDSSDGNVINPNGLFARATVFTGLGLTQKTQYVNTGGGGIATASEAKLSTGYLRAMKEGKTLGALIQREGRESVERRIIEKAHADPIFARNLARRSRQTLEEFLDVKIPEVVNLNVTVEDGRNFGLVIPAKPEK
jgi:hypothetical protein